MLSLSSPINALESPLARFHQAVIDFAAEPDVDNVLRVVGMEIFIFR